MKSILAELNVKIGARGSFVITRDGIAIASSARGTFDEERIAALAQRVLQETSEAMKRQGLGTFDRIILTADGGRMILIELSVAYLVIVTTLDVVADQVMLEIESAAHRLERASRIAV